MNLTNAARRDVVALPDLIDRDLDSIKVSTNCRAKLEGPFSSTGIADRLPGYWFRWDHLFITHEPKVLVVLIVRNNVDYIRSIRTQFFIRHAGAGGENR